MLARRLTALSLLVPLFTLGACSSPSPNRNPVGEVFPSVVGQSLEKKAWRLPEDVVGEKTILLVGYVQDAQFDIDRWLIALEQTKVQLPVFEVPTITGMVPRLISGTIDDGMRSGIPQEIWKAVITVYAGAGVIKAFTGSERPRNARVLLLDEKGKVDFFHDGGFSPLHLRALLARVPAEKKSPCW
jgi:hypothetical protein